MSGAIVIRSAGLPDLDTIVELGTTTFFETYASQNTKEAMDHYLAEKFTPDQLAVELSDARNQFLLAFLEGEPAGYAKFRIDQFVEVPEREKAMQLERIYVLKRFHGNRIGDALLQHCFSMTAPLGVDVVWLTVWTKNPKAIRFYERQGFYIEGEIIFDFAGDPQMDFLMKKVL